MYLPTADTERTSSYLVGTPDACPSCRQSHWLVGRTVAECASCGDALPIVPRRPMLRPVAHVTLGYAAKALAGTA